MQEEACRPDRRLGEWAGALERPDTEEGPPQEPAVELVLAGDFSAALQAAQGRKDPEDRYLDLILVAAACARRGNEPAARAAAALAVDRYRPIVEEGLYVLYARYLAELALVLPRAEIGEFVAVMEPEVAALGALPAAADPPLPFLALYNDLYLAAHGWNAALGHASGHPASHLLLGDLASRAPADPALDAALADLAGEAAREASALARQAASGAADPFLRDRLRRSLLRQIAAIRALFDREPDLAARALLGEESGGGGLPLDALAALPRGLRLEALQAMASALEPLPLEHLAALYPGFLLAAHPPGVETGSMLRRQAAHVARITAPFLAAEPVAGHDIEGLVAWFLDEDAYLGEGAAEEAARNFAQALVPLGARAGPSLEALLGWAEREAPPGAPAVLAAWAVACANSPTALRPGCFDTPTGTRMIVREAPPELRPEWVRAALAGSDWDVRDLVLSADLDLQRAIADLLTYHPAPLEDAALAAAARSVILGEHDPGPYGRTLAMLGPEPAAYPLAVLLDARVASRGYASSEHDQALRQIVSWALAGDAGTALRLAMGFGTRNHVSWVLGTLLAEGSAGALEAEAVREAAPHPFLLGAYLLEMAERAS